MAAPWQTAQISFRGGIDERTVAELVQPGARLLDVLNGVFAHDGAIEKRPGMRALTTACVANGPTMGQPIALFSNQGELLATDGESLYSYSPGLAIWTSISGASETAQTGGPAQVNALMPGCSATRVPHAPGVGTVPFQLGGAMSVCEGSGVRLTTSTTSTVGTLAFLSDIATGAPLEIAGVLGGGAGTYNCTGFIQAGFAYLIFSDAGHIYVQVVNLTTGAFSQTTLVSDAASQVFDAVAYTGSTTGIFIAYNQTGNLGHVRCLRLENLPLLTITGSFYTPYRTGGGSLDGAATVIAARVDAGLGVAFISWEVQTAGPVNYVLVVAYNVPAWTQINLGGVSTPLQPAIPGYTQGGTASAGMISVEPISATQFWIQCFFGTSGGPYPSYATYTNASGALFNSGSFPYCFTASRPMRVTQGGTTRLYVAMCDFEQITSIGATLTEFCTVHLYDTRAYEATVTTPTNGTWPRIVATLAPRQANFNFYATTANTNGGINWRPAVGTNQGAPSAGSYTIPLGINQSEEFATGVTASSWLGTYTFPAAYSYCEGNGQAYIGAGVPMVHATKVYELGMHMWPSRCSGTPGTGGSLTVSSTYGYAIVFAAVDTSGFIHRSAAYTFNVTLSSGQNQVALALQGVAYTQRTNLQIEVYRTAANGSTYYFLTSHTAFATSPGGAINITDSAADTAITSNALLYTTGGVVQSVAPPSFRQVMRHVERLWGIDDTGYVVWFSTPLPSPGTGGDAPMFNEALTLTFSDDMLTAMASLDDKAVFWSSRNIWYVEGYGPNNLGQGSDLTTAVLLPSDVGCASWQSVCAFPGGLFFQAPSGGIYVLDRGMSVTFIGKDVQDITAGVSVVSAELVPTSNHVRFVLSTGIVLTYDYVFARWARLQLTPAIFGTPTSAAMVGNTWTAACSGGMVAQEKSVIGLPAHCYQDSTAAGTHSFVSTSAVLANVKPGGLQGWAILGQVQGYADWADPADIIMSLTFDYGNATQGPKTFTYGILHPANPNAAKWSMAPQGGNIAASAVQVSFSDAAPTGGNVMTGQGVRWLGFAFDVNPIGGRNPELATGVKA